MSLEPRVNEHMGLHQIVFTNKTTRPVLVVPSTPEPPQFYTSLTGDISSVSRDGKVRLTLTEEVKDTESLEVRVVMSDGREEAVKEWRVVAGTAPWARVIEIQVEYEGEIEGAWIEVRATKDIRGLH